ncbi:MAG: hypothetical protein KGH74_03505 [Candidatus Micrarchaeota archaeon]|nr:hypothetical protein [Candidatus Micrarchaeota archaeon]
MALRAMVLVSVALFLLVIPGLLYNNLNSTGITPAQVLTCPNTQLSGGGVDVTCQGSVNAGCQASASYCSLSGSSFSFLNINSPFTALITGNVWGVFNQIVQGSQPTTHGPFDSVGGSASFIRANCIIDNRGANSLTGWTIDQCTQADSDGSNMTTGFNTWSNWNNNFVGSTKTISFKNLIVYIPAYSGNSSYTLICNWNIQTNYTFSGTPFSGYTWYGCAYQNTIGGSFPTNEKTNPSWPFLISVPWATGVLDPTKGYTCGYISAPAKCFHQLVYVQLETWHTFECVFVAKTNQRQLWPFLISPQCDQWWDNVKTQSVSSGANFGILTPIIVFIIGLALLFLGLGIGLTGGGSILGTGTTVGISSNRQGTKMAQILGMGLIVWAPLYSEFSTWFTTGLLPYGLDGSLGVVGIGLTGLFFFGIFWLIQSD